MKRSTIPLLVALSLVGAPAFAQQRPTVLHTPPEQVQSGEPIVLEAEVSGWELFQKLVIRFRGPGDDFREAPFELQYGDMFRGLLPPSAVQPPGVEYFLEGVSASGSRTEIFQSRRRPYRVRVTGARTAEPPRDEKKDDRRDRRRRAVAIDDPDAAFDAPEPEPEPEPEPAPARRVELEMPPPPKAVAKEERRDDRRLGTTAATSTPEVAPKPPDEDLGFSTIPGPTREVRRRDALADELTMFTAVDPTALALEADEQRAREPGFVTRFDSRQLRTLGVRQVYDVLDLVPGMTVSRDVQGFHRVGVRGIRNDPEVLFLLDGHRLNNLFDGRALGTIPIENLEQIEIHRGPGTAKFGAGALLAVVNLITRKDEGVRVSLAGGSYDAFDGHLNAAGALGGLTLSGDANVVSRYGFRKDVPGDALSADTLAQGLRDRADPAGTTNDQRLLVNVGGRAALDGGPAGSVSLSTRVLYEDRAALIGLFDAVGSGSKLGWLAVLGDLRLERPVGEGLRFFANLALDHQSTNRLYHLTPKGYRTGGDADQLFELGLREQTRFGALGIALDVGADARFGERNLFHAGVRVERQDLTDYAFETNYTAESRVLSEFARPEGHAYPTERGAAGSRLSFAAYLEDRWTPLEALSLDLGLRVLAVQLPRAEDPSTTSYVPSLNPRAALSFAVAEPLVLKLQYARAFRAPTVQELAEEIPNTSFNQGRFEGNPLLRPTTIDQVDFGGEWVDLSGGARIHLRANGFFQHIKDAIVAVDTTGNVIPLSNRAAVRVYGVEGSARAHLSSRVVAWANLSFFRAEDLDGQPSLLTDVPQARFNAGFSLPLGRWLNLDTHLRYGSERRNNIRSVLEQIRTYRIPGYAVLTTQLRSERIADHFEVALLATNVFDQELIDDAPRPDRITGMIPREGLQAFFTVRAFY